jgi:hypothetical protein
MLEPIVDETLLGSATLAFNIFNALTMLFSVAGKGVMAIAVQCAWPISVQLAAEEMVLLRLLGQNR